MGQECLALCPSGWDFANYSLMLVACRCCRDGGVSLEEFEVCFFIEILDPKQIITYAFLSLWQGQA